MAHEEPLMIMDAGGSVLRWSHQAQDLLGFSATDVVGLPMESLLARSHAGSERRRGGWALRHRDGGEVQADLQARPVLLEDDSLGWAVFQAPARKRDSDAMLPALLEALFTQSPVGLHIFDPQLRLVRVNTATPSMQGVPTEQLLGRGLSDVYGSAVQADLEGMVRRVLETGVPVLRHLMSARITADPNRVHTYEASAFRLQEAAGAVLGVAVAAVEVTDREKARARVQVLNTVRERVGHTLDVVATCEELIEAVVPEFADIAVVDIVDPVVRGEEPPLGPLNPDVPLRRVAFGSAKAGQAQAHPIGDVRSLPSSSPYAQSLSDLRPRLVTLRGDLPELRTDPARAAAIRVSGAHTLITVPLTLRGTVLGLMSLYRTASADPFDQDDVDMVLELAVHTALCVNDARRYTHEHSIAAILQRHLLPQDSGRRTAVETAHLHLPGEGEGGWFDTIALSGARTALVVGDVAGHGIYAATAMGQLRTVIHSLAALDLEPDELLARLDETVNRLAAERAALPSADPLHRDPLAATCIYAVYDPASLTCTVSRAGHSPLLVVGPDGSSEFPDLPAGPSLGGGEGLPFATATVPLAEGSILAFYTSALLPEPSPGIPTHPADLLRQALAHPGLPLQDQCDAVLYDLGAAPRRGDRILLLARTSALPAEDIATWHVDAHPTAVSTARACAIRKLAEWNLSEDVAYAAELVVSELVTNAIRYGAPPLRLRLIKHGALTCEVQDTSLTAPHLRHARTVDETGRGLFIIGQLARTWGTRFTPDSKTVWAELALEPALP
ncbi:SpoIIE family protein phosphatase [Streptomyces sp. NPDC058320]|uniref:ATP-binding SpoIIE family protein phosphatase n=1 Tax=unclassified Streptomyces TaxID=2593676 RepID=UPI00362C891A